VLRPIGLIVRIVTETIQRIVDRQALDAEFDIQPVIQQADRVLQIELRRFAHRSVVAAEIHNLVPDHVAVRSAAGLVETQLRAGIILVLIPGAKFQRMVGNLPRHASQCALPRPANARQAILDAARMDHVEPQRHLAIVDVAGVGIAIRRHAIPVLVFLVRGCRQADAGR